MYTFNFLLDVKVEYILAVSVVLMYVGCVEGMKEAPHETLCLRMQKPIQIIGIVI